jgi:hypothetical protein
MWDLWGGKTAKSGKTHRNEERWGMISPKRPRKADVSSAFAGAHREYEKVWRRARNGDTTREYASCASLFLLCCRFCPQRLTKERN